VWLPQAPLVFASARQSSAGVACGVVLLVALSAAFDTLPRHVLWLYGQVAALWIIALWLYPQALHRLWLGRQPADLRAG
jgi:hypothetical protein